MCLTQGCISHLLLYCCPCSLMFTRTSLTVSPYVLCPCSSVFFWVQTWSVFIIIISNPPLIFLFIYLFICQRAGASEVIWLSANKDIVFRSESWVSGILILEVTIWKKIRCVPYSAPLFSGLLVTDQAGLMREEPFRKHWHVITLWVSGMDFSFISFEAFSS